MKPIAGPTPVSTATGFALAAFGTARASVDEVAAWRTRLRAPGGEPFPPSFLKHADEQTVVGLAAVFRAIERFGLAGARFTDWAVLAGPRFLGRASLAVALQRFAQEGAWGVSPHLIPHRSLHSVSGTVSQALAIHGPNFGVGGGPDSAGEALLAAAALCSDAALPGVWVVLTGWDPEPVLERPNVPSVNGSGPSHSLYGAVALALKPDQPDRGGPRFRVHPAPAADPRNETPNRFPGAALPALQMEALLRVLETGATEAAWRLGCGGWLDFEGLPDGPENCQ